MVHFVGAPDSSSIPIVGVPEHFETLVDKNIVHNKIGEPIGENPEPDGQSGPKSKIAPANKTTDAHQGIEQKEIVIALPPATVILMMVIFVQTP